MTQTKGMRFSQWQKGTFAWNKAVRSECPGSFVHGQTEGFMINLELSSNNSDNMDMRALCANVGGCYLGGALQLSVASGQLSRVNGHMIDT